MLILLSTFLIYIFSDFTNCLEKKVNLTFSAWKGTDCDFSYSPPNCNTQNLKFIFSKTFSLGNLDSKCLNIPSDHPYSVDPNETIWPHSYDLSFNTSGAFSFDVMVEKICSPTSDFIKLAVFKLLNCQSKDFYRVISVPLNKAIPMVHSPFGSQYNFTYSFDCQVYSSSSEIQNINIYKIIGMLILVFSS
jgi:hypothetical protein